MLVRLFEDLRFVIGAFFAIISILLLVQGMMSAIPTPGVLNLNLLSGFGMGIFSVFMLGSAILAVKRD